MLFLLLRMRRAAAWKLRRSFSWACCGPRRLWTVAVVIPIPFRVQRWRVAGNEPFASAGTATGGRLQKAGRPLQHSPIKSGIRPETSGERGP